jgi:hypothetical protein
MARLSTQVSAALPFVIPTEEEMARTKNKWVALDFEQTTGRRQVEHSVGSERKAVEGFAHRFRPTYAGANVGHPCGAVGPARGLRARPAVFHHPALVAGIEPKSAFLLHST